MDDIPKTLIKLQTPQWEPRQGAGGTVEVFVIYMHDNGRYVSDAVPLARYIELFDAGRIKWQREGTERPEHNPSREMAVRELEKETERLEYRRW